MQLSRAKPGNPASIYIYIIYCIQVFTFCGVSTSAAGSLVLGFFLNEHSDIIHFTQINMHHSNLPFVCCCR